MQRRLDVVYAAMESLLSHLSKALDVEDMALNLNLPVMKMTNFVGKFKLAIDDMNK